MNAYDHKIDWKLSYADKIINLAYDKIIKHITNFYVTRKLGPPKINVLTEFETIFKYVSYLPHILFLLKIVETKPYNPLFPLRKITSKMPKNLIIYIKVEQWNEIGIIVQDNKINIVDDSIRWKTNIYEKSILSLKTLLEKMELNDGIKDTILKLYLKSSKSENSEYKRYRLLNEK